MVLPDYFLVTESLMEIRTECFIEGEELMDVDDVGIGNDVEGLLLLRFPVDIDSKGSIAVRTAIENDMPRLNIREPIKRGDNVAGTARNRRIGDMNDLHHALPRRSRLYGWRGRLFLFNRCMSQCVPVIPFNNVTPKRALRREVHHPYASTA